MAWDRLAEMAWAWPSGRPSVAIAVVAIAVLAAAVARPVAAAVVAAVVAAFAAAAATASFCHKLSSVQCLICLRE